MNTLNLQESFEAKDEDQFLKKFPKDFKEFQELFGWNSVKNEPNELYDLGYEYVNYLFSLVNSENEKQFESLLIGICMNGKWEADAVNYFQNNTLNYIKTNKKYRLINEIEDEKAKSVLYFLFDSPYPKLDEVFYSHLNAQKQGIVIELFKTTLSETGGDSSVIDFNMYKNNDEYFIEDIDINNDSLIDKVVSSKSYLGDELLLFVNTQKSYRLALKTTNFSEDGGNQVTDIKKHLNGFVITTAFPDRGFFESNYYIVFQDNSWILTHSIYKTESSSQSDAFIYVCEVKQNIDMSKSDFMDKLKWIPDESVREKTCSKVFK